MKKEIFNEFCKILGSDHVWCDEPMKKHTTFRIGGPAAYYLCPHSIEEVQKVLQICRDEKLPGFIMGNGSNLLVSDKGYDGVVVQLYKNFSHSRVEGTCLIAQAGALLSSLSKMAMEAGLTGMEFAGGIPGTLGGAVVMNAGAYDGEMKHILKQVTVLTPEGEVLTLQAAELEMGYRTSKVKTANYIVLEAVIELQKGNQDAIRARMRELTELRTSKQPLEYPSAGSTFKRPTGYFAGKLIMESGLRGYRVGGAQVSEKHCGFVINTGDATASDVVQLMKDVAEKVKKDSGVELEPEVKFLGEF